MSRLLCQHQDRLRGKRPFQIKSGIWAHFSSRGLIDLSITAAKKVDLSDAGVVGRLSNRSEAGATMGIGPDFPSSAGPTGGGGYFQQRQSGNF